MARTRAIKTASKPGGGRGVSAARTTGRKVVKTPPAKKKKAAAKKAARPKTGLALKRANGKRLRTAVEQRKRTRSSTNVMVGPEPVAVDPHDEVAIASIARRQVRGRSAVERANDPPPATGIALVERVTRAVERELSQIEVIVGGHHLKPQQRTEAERRARTLASLARTLTEVRKLRADEHRVKPHDDPDRPQDLEELRRRLSERLKNMVRGTMDHPAGKPETGGDELPD